MITDNILIPVKFHRLKKTIFIEKFGKSTLPVTFLEYFREKKSFLDQKLYLQEISTSPTL